MNRSSANSQTQPSILFYTTAGFSAGHDRRIANISQALRTQNPGVRVVIVTTAKYGGARVRPAERLPGCTIVELPNPTPNGLAPREIPTGGGEFNRFPGVAASRRRSLTTALAGLAFDVAVIEAFPFLTQEETEEVEYLLALARNASSRMEILFSVRDVLYGRRIDIFDPESKRFAESFARRHGRRLLVHGDPNLLLLEASYGDTSGIADLVTYTGIVTRAEKPSRSPRGVHVVCSHGGTRKWHIPTLKFLEAWRMLRNANRLPPETRGYVFTGLEDPNAELRQLRAGYDDCFETDAMALEHATWNDFPELAAGAACSVSQCGYNTAYELAAWGTPAIFEPRPHNGPDRRAEGEHWVRAKRLQEKGWARIATTVDEMADEIVRCIENPATLESDIDFGGAEATARILLDHARGG